MSDKEIHRICNKYDIKNYTIEDGLVNVDGSVYLNNKRLSKLPLEFGIVSGNFWCYDNWLINLRGAPLEVGSGFYCYNNKLTSLKGAPIKVGYVFNCSSNNLTSLEGAPRELGGGFYCYDNPKKLSYGKYLLRMNRLNKLKQLDVR